MKKLSIIAPAALLLAACSTAEPVTETVTEEVTVTETVTEEVVVEVEVLPDACIEALDHSEEIRSIAADFTIAVVEKGEAEAEVWGGLANNDFTSVDAYLVAFEEFNGTVDGLADRTVAVVDPYLAAREACLSSQS